MSSPRRVRGPYLDDNFYKIAYVKIYYFPKIISPLVEGKIARAIICASATASQVWTQTGQGREDHKRPDKTGQDRTRPDKTGQDLIFQFGKMFQFDI